MTTKQNIYDPKFNWPGKRLGDYVWEFPTITTQKKVQLKKGGYNSTSWTIYAGVIEVTEKPFDIELFTKIVDGINNEDEISQLFESSVSKIKNSYFNHIEIEGFVGFTIVNAKQIGSKDSFKMFTIIEKGKNLKKKNKTNVFTQAMSDAYSKYVKKIPKNKFYKPMNAEGEGVLIENMLEHITELVTKYKNNFSLQTKFDGTRCLSRYNPKTKEIVSYSRGLVKQEVSKILEKEIRQVLESIENFGRPVIIDGELYNHSLDLNEISGINRNTGKHDINIENKRQMMNYYVFDLFFENAEGTPTNLHYPQRKLIRDKAKADNPNLKKLIFVEDFNCYNTPQEIYDLYVKLLDDGYEGLIMRINNRAYKNVRTNMIKLKNNMRDEFPITGFSDGSGKDKGCLIIECEITMNTVLRGIKFKQKKNPQFNVDLDKLFIKKGTFKVRPKDTIENRRELYTKFMMIEDNGFTHFENKYKGKEYTVQFQDYHDNMIPQRPIGIDFI